MKKITLCLVAFAATLGAFAQNEKCCSNCDFTPQKGDFSLEIQIDPCNKGNWFSATKEFGIDALKARYFVSNKDALMFQVGIHGNNHKEVPNTEKANAFTSSYEGNFILNLGYERHFSSSNRLDPFVGAALSYTRTFSGEKSQEDLYKYDKTSTGANGVGLACYAGFDFYIYKGLFCGVELGMGFQDMMASKTTTITRNGGNEKKIESKTGGHNFDFKTKVNSLIRLGWKF